jgi:hypothetical protein
VSHDPLYIFVVPVCSTRDLMVVLTNPDPCTRRGDSCASPEATSRVVLSVPASGRCPYPDSRVLLKGELGLHSDRRGGVP